MVKKLKSKKGIFFTAMLVFMSSTLLTLTILLFHNSLESENRFVELSSLETIHNLYGSIENSIIKIFLYETGEDYIYRDTNEFFKFQSQSILYDWNLTTAKVQQIEPVLLEFEEFVEENYDFITLNIYFYSNSIEIDININPPGMKVKKKRFISFT